MPTASEVAHFISKEYLEKFVAGGGAAVKVLSAEAEPRAQFITQLRARAIEGGLATADLLASTDRLHLAQELFFAVARQLDWNDIARAQLDTVAVRAGLALPPNHDYSLKELAEHNDLEPRQLNIELQREMRRSVLRNPNYTRLFKHAILALVSGSLDPTGPAGFLAKYVTAWLRGERVELKILKQAHISRRIGRQNARALLLDLGRWLHNVGRKGLVITSDVSAYADGAARADLKRYTPSAALDLFELIRQFIDQSDLSTGLLFVFAFGPEFVFDRRRGMNAYLALKMRLADDVYDTAHPNLMAPLLRLAEC